MAKRKISVEEFTNDVLAGMTDDDLMQKYRISRKHLEAMFAKLLQRGDLQAADLNDAAQKALEPTLELAATCPHCGALNLFGGAQCPECGQSRITRQFQAMDTQDVEPLRSEPQLQIPETQALPPHDQASLGDVEGLKTVDVTVLPPVAETREVAEPARPPSRRRPRRIFGLVAACTLVVLAGVVAVGLYTHMLSLPFGVGPHPPAAVTKPLPRPAPWGTAQKRSARVSPAQEQQSPRQVPTQPVQAPRASVPEPTRSEPLPSQPVPTIPEPHIPAISSEPAPAKQTAPAKAEEPAPVKIAKEAPAARTKEPVPEQRKVERPLPHADKPASVDTAKEPAPNKGDGISSEKASGETPPSIAEEPSREHPQLELRVHEPEKPAAKETATKPAPERTPQPPPVAPSAEIPSDAKRDESAPSQQPQSTAPDTIQPHRERPRETPTHEPFAVNAPQPPAYKLAALPPTEQPRPAPRTHEDMGRLLMEAVRNGNRDMMIALLDAGANPDSADSEGATPLMIAARTRCLTCVAALLTRGADVRVKDRQGNTALDMARRAGRTGAAELILAHDPEKGPAALLIASREGLSDLVQCLVANGVDVNSTDQDGNTALMAASEKGNLGVVSILLKKGADVRARNNQGQTALTAVSRPHSGSSSVSPRIRRELLRMLERHKTP